ncbi:MAG TPA: hypothetical protein VKM55_11465 [Candidatus Lokiarchaeia archaeon]|nr:hypothetical protein [Candidatus Lokiarchaeia archaeon]
MSGDDDDELAALRRKKMAALLERQKEDQLRQELKQNVSAAMEQKIEYCLSFLLRPDAYAYLNNMKKTNPAVYRKIKDLLFPAEVLLRLDLLVANIRSGNVPRGDIWLVDIQQIERDLLGIKSTISYKKRGEKDRVDLSSLFKGGNDKPDEE